MNEAEDKADNVSETKDDPLERAREASRNASPHSAQVPLQFEDEDLPRHLSEASREDMDKAAFGIIELSDAGAIQFYNAFEQQLSGFTLEEVKGKNFFDDVAPCTQSERFSGKFFEGVEAGLFDYMFTYTFTYQMEPLIVKIRICRNESPQNFVLVDPMRTP